MLKKYQVYISTTQDDLKAERKELIKIITELGAMPVSMDNFNISEPESQGLIKKAILESDYFINLTAYKCGVKMEKTFSLEWEFSWALKYGIPVLSFIIDEKARWKAAKKEKDANAARALESFKKKLREHPNANWTTTADLCQKTYTYLIREMNLNPRQGWVRGDDAASPVTANELSRLSRENDQLRNRLRMEGGNLVTRLEEQLKHCLKVMAANKISLSFWYSPGENWENTKVFRYLKLFKLLVPELSTPKTTSEITRFLGTILNPDLERTVRKDNPTPTNTIKKIMADFSILKLVKSAKESKNGNIPAPGDDEAWELTELGREVFAIYRIRQMNRAVHQISPKKIPDTELSSEV